VATLWLTIYLCAARCIRVRSARILVSAAAVLDATFRSRVGCAITTGGGKEVPSMREDKDQEFETIDITALADEELDDVIGGVEPVK